MPDYRLYQSVAETLKQRIFDGEYAPGDRLPGERELADEFNVSRVTVREAEIALQAMGIIQVKPGSGAYVAPRIKRVSADLPAISALELTEARLVFESEAAALAARVISDDMLQRLAALVHVMSDVHPDDDQASLAADREFHLTIAAATSNAAVQHTIETLWRMRMELPNVRRAHASVCSDDAATERGHEHRQILQALKDRDPTAARRAMQEHFKRLLTSMIDASEAEAVEALRLEANASRQRFLNSLSQNGAT
ncbi:MAG: FadR/GntR family transcriptional regulator [Pseudomonadota bacterium]